MNVATSKNDVTSSIEADTYTEKTQLDIHSAQSNKVSDDESSPTRASRHPSDTAQQPTSMNDTKNMNNTALKQYKKKVVQKVKSVLNRYLHTGQVTDANDFKELAKKFTQNIVDAQTTKTESQYQQAIAKYQRAYQNYKIAKKETPDNIPERPAFPQRPTFRYSDESTGPKIEGYIEKWFIKHIKARPVKNKSKRSGNKQVTPVKPTYDSTGEDKRTVDDAANDKFTVHENIGKDNHDKSAFKEKTSTGTMSKHASKTLSPIHRLDQDETTPYNALSRKHKVTETFPEDSDNEDIDGMPAPIADHPTSLDTMTAAKLGISGPVTIVSRSIVTRPGGYVPPVLPLRTWHPMHEVGPYRTENPAMYSRRDYRSGDILPVTHQTMDYTYKQTRHRYKDTNDRYISRRDDIPRNVPQYGSYTSKDRTNPSKNLNRSKLSSTRAKKEGLHESDMNQSRNNKKHERSENEISLRPKKQAKQNLSPSITASMTTASQTTKELDVSSGSVADTMNVTEISLVTETSTNPTAEFNHKDKQTSRVDNNTVDTTRDENAVENAMKPSTEMNATSNPNEDEDELYDPLAVATTLMETVEHNGPSYDETLMDRSNVPQILSNHDTTNNEHVTQSDLETKADHVNQSDQFTQADQVTQSNQTHPTKDVGQSTESDHNNEAIQTGQTIDTDHSLKETSSMVNQDEDDLYNQILDSQDSPLLDYDE